MDFDLGFAVGILFRLKDKEKEREKEGMALDKFIPSWTGCPSDQDLDWLFWCSSFGSLVSQLGKRPATTEEECVDMDWELAESLPCDPFGMDLFDPEELLPADPFEMDIQTSLTVSGLASTLPNLVPTLSSPVISDGSVASDASSEMEVPSSSAPVSTAGQVPEGMVYGLGYLGLKDLLSVEQVCKSLHEAVRGDPLLWMSIQIDSTLSERINDETLLKVTRKAQGNLRSLSLVACLNVTDEGLRCVLEENPLLTKVSPM